MARVAKVTGRLDDGALWLRLTSSSSLAPDLVDATFLAQGIESRFFLSVVSPRCQCSATGAHTKLVAPEERILSDESTTFWIARQGGGAEHRDLSASSVFALTSAER